jgi:hypothetical protein
LFLANRGKATQNALMRGLLWVICLSLLACGPRTLSVRLRDAERLAGRLDRELDEARAAEDKLEPEEAARALERVKQQLENRDLHLYPESDALKARYQELETALPKVRADRAARDLERKLDALRDDVVARAQKLQDALENLSATAPTKREIDAVEDPAKDVRSRLEEARTLFAKDPAFASWAKNQDAKAEKALEEVGLARLRVQYIEGPGAALDEALKTSQEAKSTTDLEERVAKLGAARKKCVVCIEGSVRALETPALGVSPLPVGGKIQPPVTALAVCRALEQRLTAEVEAAKQAIAKEAAAKKAAEAKAEKKAAADQAAKKAAEAKAEKKAAADQAAKKAAEAKAEKKAAADQAAKKAAEAKAAKKPPSKKAAGKSAKAGP